MNLEMKNGEDPHTRFRKLVYTDFSFVSRYGHEKIEERYAKAIFE